MYPPGCQRNGFVATHALGHMMYGLTKRYISYHKAILLITERAHCFHDWIYIYIYIYINGINNSYFLQNIKIYQYIYIKKKNLFGLKRIRETSCFFLLLEKVKAKYLSDKSTLWIKVT